MVRVDGQNTVISDPRGPVIEAIETVRNSVTPETAARMVALYEAGASTRQVAAEVGMHRQTVMRHLRRAGVTRYRVGLGASGIV